MANSIKPGIVAWLPVSSLSVDPNQPRKAFHKESLQALADSLKVKVEVPLIVRLIGNKTMIVDGERRYRAAKLANIKELPCLLDNREGLDVSVTQLTTAVHREELAPIDIALFLNDLRHREKKSVNELQSELAKRGIVEIGEAKIERYLRLLELPDWAQEMLRDGTLQERHGYALYAAAKFPAVLREIRSSIREKISFAGAITIKELERKIENAFRHVGIDLNRQHFYSNRDEKPRAFPIAQCRGCEFYKKIGGAEYCLNKKLYDRKQKAGLELQATKEQEKADRARKIAKENPLETDPTKVTPRPLKLSKDNVVTLRRMDIDKRRELWPASFDKTQCKTCPHRQLASHDGTTKNAQDYCFHPPCFFEKERTSRRGESRRQKLREYFEAWLRPIVAREVPARLSEKQLAGIVLWLATGAVDQYSRHYPIRSPEKAADSTASWLDHFGIKDLPSLMEFATTNFERMHLEQLFKAAAEVFSRDQLRWIAQYAGLQLNEPKPGIAFRIDEAYLNMKRKAELSEMAHEIGVETIENISVPDLRALVLSKREDIGVPEDIQSIYLEPPQQPDDADEESDIGESDEEPYIDPFAEEAGAAALENQAADIAGSLAADAPQKKRRNG